METVENKSKGGKYIKPSVRTAIKRMAYMNQIAKSVVLIPSPEEFASQVIDEVTILLCKIKDFSERINIILEAYTNFPSNFLEGSVNNIMGTLTNYANVATGATQGMVNALHHATDNIDYLTTSTTGLLEDAITGLNDAPNLLGDSVEDIHEGLNDISNSVNNIVDNGNESNNRVKSKLQSVIDTINNTMKKTNDYLNEAFSEYMVKEDTTKQLDMISESSRDGSMGGELASVATDTVSTIARNFNIGKITTGFIGFATQIGLIAAGIDKLPYLNLDTVLAFGKAKLDDTHNTISEKTREFKESDEYKRIVEEAEGDKKKIRAILREKRKSSAQERRKSMQSLTEEEKIAKRSVAKDIRKAKLQAKKAKMAQKMKETALVELKRFEQDIKMFGMNIKDEWTIMENQYKQSIFEIKEFFTGDPNKMSGSKYIDDCCDAIEMDCDSIKETLKNLTVTITVTIAQIPCPTSLGPCFDNPLYKVLRWFECAKVIFNELRRVINFGIDIIKQIDNLVKIMLNGLNSAKIIKEKIIDILNIKWLLDFIDSIIELFTGKCLEGKELIENTLSPIYYNETDSYEQQMEALEAQVSEINEDKQKKKAENLQERIDELEERGNEICAYKSPILNEDGTDFKGWIYYYDNIDNKYASNQKLKQFFSRMIMKRAAKTGNRKRGGVNMLKSKNVFKLHYGMTIDGKMEYKPKAYDAFYWYTKWTTEPTDDSLDRGINGIDIDNHDDVVSPIMTTENGTLVELEDGRRVFVNDFGIKSGDYVIVEGQRYRVR